MRKMARYLLWLCLCAVILGFLTGCEKTVKPLEEPLALTAFTYRHSGMSAADAYSMTLEKVENGTHGTLELNSGTVCAQVTLQEDLLADIAAENARIEAERQK